MDEMKRKGELIRRYILSLVYEDEIPDVVSQAINDLVQAAQQGVQADTRHAPDGKVASSEHNPNAWENGFDAWQNGYDDAMYDGIDTSFELPCKCEGCLKGYAEGQEAALKEIFAGSQSSKSGAAHQQSAVPTV